MDTSSSYAAPRLLACGESAVSVELGDRIDPAVNDRVYALVDMIERSGIPGIIEAAPTYRSVLVEYDVARTGFDEVTTALKGILDRCLLGVGGSEPGQVRRTATLYSLPVVYGGEDGPDLEDVAVHAGMSVQDVISIHSNADYRVYMLGFAPGFPYLGGMDSRIATPRLPTPRTRVPGGSVGIADSQTGVYPMETPGGWRIIGRTPVRLFDPAGDPPVAIMPGSFVRFVPVSQDQAHETEEEIARGSYRIERAEITV